MWPFKKKQPREEVTVEGVTAKSMARDSWEFSVDGLDFMITGKEFDPRAIQWAKDAALEISRLEPEMVKAVRESLEEAEELDLGSAKLFIVDLSEYGKDRYFSVTYVGDDSWGDMGVDVTIQDGKIISADAGD